MCSTLDMTQAQLCMALEPLPFHPNYTHSDEYANDPFFQSMLELLATIDEQSPPDQLQNKSSAWPQLSTIKIPFEAGAHTLSGDEVAMTPDDQRPLPSLSQVISPSGGVDPSRKRLHVETIAFGTVEDEDDGQQHKRMLTNSRRDAVVKLRDEARALETTLKGLQLRKSRPKATVSEDPDALIKSYSENIQLKRAIEEQDARIKTLRRAVSLRGGKELSPQPALVCDE